MTHSARFPLLLAAALALGACGSDDAGSSATSEPVSLTGAAVPTAALPTAALPTPVLPTAALPATSPPTTSVAATPAASPATTGGGAITLSPIETPAPAPSAPQATEPLTIAELLHLGRPIVLAHAGGEDEHPHSTPFAYAESAAAGVDVLDFDVQLTADGVLVVQHDDTVERTTDGTGAVAEMTYDQLHALDDAYWFTAECVCRDRPDSEYVYRGVRTGAKPPPPGYTAEDFAIARFDDLVRRFPSFPLNIEIKGEGERGAAAASELARVLTATGRTANAVVTSFDDATVAAFQQAAPDVEVTPGLGLSSAFILQGRPLPAGMRILQLPPVFSGIEVLSPQNVAKAHAAGYVIWVWPNDRSLEDRQSYIDLLERGMDGLNINFPAAGVQALDEFLGALG